MASPRLYYHAGIWLSLPSTIADSHQQQTWPEIQLMCLHRLYATNKKGYRCLDRASGRVYTSRHVNFVEEMFPFSLELPTHVQTKESMPLLPLSDMSVIHLPHSLPITDHLQTTLPEPNRSEHSQSEISFEAYYPPISSPEPDNNESTSPFVSIAPPHPTHQMQTRLKSCISKPRQLLSLSHSVADAVPTCVSKAMQDPRWKYDMDDEYNTLLSNCTWELVPPKPIMNIFGSKCVLKINKKSLMGQ